MAPKDFWGFDIEPFNDVVPCVYMNGNYYFWDSVVTRAQVPRNFEKWGKLSVTTGIPAENGQIMAFDLEGEIYTDSEASEVVYLWIESDLLTYWKGGNFVRFITEYMGHQGKGEIFLFGKRYSCVENINYYGVVDTLPDGYESVGALVYIGEDYLPGTHLETNHYEAQLRKSEAFYSEECPEKIYISTVSGGEKKTVYRLAVLLEEDEK